jgi:hypothetical protein
VPASGLIAAPSGSTLRCRSMIGERTEAGWEVRLRPCGARRWGAAAFLLLWLCFWAVGEAVVLVVLAGGLYGLLTGGPVLGRALPATLGPLFLVGAFLSLWLAFWTWGGLAALHELLRLTGSEDRLVIHPRGLTRRRRVGPLHIACDFPREVLRAVYVRRYQTALMAQVGAEVRELSVLGTLEDRLETAALIRQAFGLPESEGPLLSEALPSGWQTAVAPEGGMLLVPAVGTRRRQALALTLGAAGAWAVALALARDTPRNPSLGALAAMVLAAACWLAWKCVWLWRGRNEWRIEPGRLTRQRRFGARLTVRGEATRLELNERTDGDGDRWYELDAVADAGARHRLMQAIHDDTDPRLLGQWLARQAGIPLDDRVPSAAERARELAHAREALALTGRFLTRWLGRRDPH